MNGILVLVRHGESEWNAKNVWTGLTDIGLTQKGRDEAAKARDALKDISFDAAFTSPLSRAKETLSIMRGDLKVTESPALNERDYGIYTGKNKLEIKKELGEENFLKLRRGWDYPVPSGESLKQVYARVIPYYEQEILPLLKIGKNVLIVAHGNSLRALIKYLDHISDDDIAGVELATGEIVTYTIDPSGAVEQKEKLLTS